MFPSEVGVATESKNRRRSYACIELDVIKEFSGKASLRADIEYVSDGAGNFDMDLEQGYLSYNFQIASAEGLEHENFWLRNGEKSQQKSSEMC